MIYVLTEDGFLRGSYRAKGSEVEWDPVAEGKPPWYYEERADQPADDEEEEVEEESVGDAAEQSGSGISEREVQVTHACNQLNHSNPKHFNDGSGRPKVAVVSKILVDAGHEPTSSAEIQDIIPEFRRDER